MTSSVGLRVALVAAALAALIVLLDLFSTGFRVFCLGVIAAATLLASPDRTRQLGWWWILAAGAVASVLGAIIAQPAATLGGWFALVGGLLVIIAATIGFQLDEE